MSTPEPKIQVQLAVIALVSTLGVGVLGNLDKILSVANPPSTPIISLPPPKVDELFKKASQSEKMALNLTPETGLGLSEENLSKSIQHWQNASRLMQEILSSDQNSDRAKENLAKYQANLIYTEALKFGIIAAKLTTKAGEKNTLSIEEWQNIEKLWGQALAKLKEIQPTDPNYKSANEKISTYKDNLAYAGQAKLIANFMQGSRKANEALALTTLAESQYDWLKIAGLWTQSIDLMNNVPKESQFYSEVPNRIRLYQSKLRDARQKAIQSQ